MIKVKKHRRIFKPVKDEKHFNRQQLAAGTRVEMEHTYRKPIASIIARHHLQEHKDYYKKLKTMESEF